MVVTPTLMWVKALDMILDKLRVCGVDFSKVAAISGCAQVNKSQQHENCKIHMLSTTSVAKNYTK